MELKIGDRVQVKDSNLTGMITQCQEGYRSCLCVRLDKEDTWTFTQHELQYQEGKT